MNLKKNVIFFFIINISYTISFSQNLSNYFFLPSEQFLIISSNYIDNNPNGITQHQYNTIKRNKHKNKFIIFEQENENTSKMLIPLNIEIANKFNKVIKDESINYYSNNENICFINKKQMMMASLNEIINSQNYSYIDRIKDVVKIDENLINFYILDVISNNNMRVYFHEDRKSDLSIAENIINEKCIEFWRNTCFPKIRKSSIIPPIKVKIFNWVNDSPINRWVRNQVYFFNDNNGWEKMDINKGDANSIILEFDFNKNGHLLLYCENNDDRNKKGNQIIRGSIYNNLIKKYYRQNQILLVNDRTFLLFILSKHTPDFDVGNSDLTEAIKLSLGSSMEKIEEYLNKYNNVYLTINIIGYADTTFREELGEKDWLDANERISLERALQVREWFNQQLNIYYNRVNILARGCPKRESNYNNRGVKIIAFDY